MVYSQLCLLISSQWLYVLLLKAHIIMLHGFHILSVIVVKCSFIVLFAALKSLERLFVRLCLLLCLFIIYVNGMFAFD